MSRTPNPVAVEQEPNAHYDRLETLLKNLPGMAYRCLNQEHWPMDFVSDGCYDLCGYHRHEIASQQVLWGDFTHPDMIDEVERIVSKAAENGGTDGDVPGVTASIDGDSNEGDARDTRNVDGADGHTTNAPESRAAAEERQREEEDTRLARELARNARPGVPILAFKFAHGRGVMLRG